MPVGVSQEKYYCQRCPTTTKKKFLYNNMFIAFVMRMFIEKFQGYPEDNTSKLTFEKLDFKVDLLTSLRSRDVKTK